MEKKMTNNQMQISKDLAWLFDPSKESQKKREEFVDEFFGISKMEKEFGVKINNLKDTVGRI